MCGAGCIHILATSPDSQPICLPGLAVRRRSQLFGSILHHCLNHPRADCALRRRVEAAVKLLTSPRFATARAQTSKAIEAFGRILLVCPPPTAAQQLTSHCVITQRALLALQSSRL